MKFKAIALIVFVAIQQCIGVKNHQTFFGIYGKFIPANNQGSVKGSQRNILPRVNGEEGGDVKLTLGPAIKPIKTRDGPFQPSQQVSEIIGQVMHFDENMLNGRGPSVARHHPAPSAHREAEEDEEEQTPPNDELASEHGPTSQEETIENDDYNNVEKEEYIAKGREESMHFSKLLDQLEDDPGLGNSQTGNLKPTHKLEQGRLYNGFKATPKLKHPLIHRKKGCTGKRCDIAGGFFGATDGHFEPPNEDEVPYDVGDTPIIGDAEGPVQDEAMMADTLFHLHKVYDKEKQALELLGHHNGHHFHHGFGGHYYHEFPHHDVHDAHDEHHHTQMIPIGIELPNHLHSPQNFRHHGGATTVAGGAAGGTVAGGAAGGTVGGGAAGGVAGGGAPGGVAGGAAGGVEGGAAGGAAGGVEGAAGGAAGGVAGGAAGGAAGGVEGGAAGGVEGGAAGGVEAGAAGGVEGGAAGGVLELLGGGWRSLVRWRRMLEELKVEPLAELKVELLEVSKVELLEVLKVELLEVSKVVLLGVLLEGLPGELQVE
uniref:Cnidarian restricted protein n=1 Tax=Clytia hemisphaerica TaxID=252671 RepID=A0A7M5X9I2_9CNID